MSIKMLYNIPGVKLFSAQIRKDRLMVIDGSDRFDCFPTGYFARCMTTCAICKQVELPQLCNKCLIWWFTQCDCIFVAHAHAPCIRATCCADAQLNFTG